MDELILQLEQAAVKLVDEIDNVTYEHITDFIEFRESIIANMRQYESSYLLTGKNKEILTRIMNFDPIVLAKITLLKDQASEGLTKVSKARVQKQNYAPEYTPDSVFFDKKK